LGLLHYTFACYVIHNIAHRIALKASKVMS
jgi:hypothetical protein